MTAGLAPDRSLPPYSLFVVLLLSVGSGCAALIYELVWFQLLELFIGSSAVAVGVLLGTFMGGMCLGSLLLPFMVSERRHPLYVYGTLELAIGTFGMLLLAVLPVVGRVYANWIGAGASGFVLRGAVAAVCLLPPTMAMGATLPAAARWVEANTPARVVWVGWFYAGNTAGAAFGSLVAGFYLLRVYDVATATFVAAGLNGLIALAGWGLAAIIPRPSSRELPAAPRPHPTATTRVVYVAIAISGFSALAGEVVWTRILALLFGATVYTFSIILAVFLIGIGLGSAIGALVARHTGQPKRMLGWCQLLLVAAIAWTAYMLSSALPYWPIITSASPSVRYTFEINFACALLALLPGPMLWGASFPLAIAAAAGSQERDPGRLVGIVYAANTIGAIAGSLATSLILIARIGSQHVQQVMMILSAYAGVLLLLESAVAGSDRKRPVLARPGSIGLLFALGAAGWLVLEVPAIPDVLVAYGKYSVTWVGHTGDMLFVGEGLNSTVAVSRLPNGMLNYHNAGKIQASSQPQDMRLQRLLGHATTLIPKNPRTVLVIGCGSGITAGAVSIDPRVERQVIVEIERLVPDIVSTYFGPQNFDVVRNPKVRIQIDDARHYLVTTKDMFDVITADPFDPWVRGAATLYTTEFFEMAKAHLNPGGIVTMWVPLYTTTPEAAKSQIGTFFDVFPDGFILANTREGKGYDIVLVGQLAFASINLDEIEARLQQPEYAAVAQSLGQVGFTSAIDLFGNYAGSASDLKPWLAGAAINRDGNLRLQYLAGLGLDVDRPEVIYEEMKRYRQHPRDLFTGSEQTLSRLLSAMN